MQTALSLDFGSSPDRLLQGRKRPAQHTPRGPPPKRSLSIELLSPLAGLRLDQVASPPRLGGEPPEYTCRRRGAAPHGPSPLAKATGRLLPHHRRWLALAASADPPAGHPSPTLRCPSPAGESGEASPSPWASRLRPHSSPRHTPTLPAGEEGVATPCRGSPRIFALCTPVKFPALSPAHLQAWLDQVSQALEPARLPDRDHPARVLPFLYLGSQKHARAAKVMGAMGATHVVACAKSASLPTDTRDQSRSYLVVDAEDNETYPILSIHWEEVYAFIEAARRAEGCVFIHCVAGVNRSATLAIAYCLLHNRWPLIKAVQHVFQLRPFILTNVFFQRQLIQFAHTHGLLG